MFFLINQKVLLYLNITIVMFTILWILWWREGRFLFEKLHEFWNLCICMWIWYVFDYEPILFTKMYFFNPTNVLHHTDILRSTAVSLYNFYLSHVNPLSWLKYCQIFEFFVSHIYSNVQIIWTWSNVMKIELYFINLLWKQTLHEVVLFCMVDAFLVYLKWLNHFLMFLNPVGKHETT